MKRRILATTIAVLAVGAAWVLWPRQVLVLIVLDTTRADAAHGPWIDDLRARSTVFTHALSTSSWTAPATASIFTGLYPTEHGVIGGFRAQQRAAGKEVELTDPAIDLQGLPAGVETLPERLHAAGWRTYGVAANINIGPELGFDRGFDALHRDRNADAGDLLIRLAGWLLLAGPGRPTFLYVHLNDAHHPYRIRRPWFLEPGDAGAQDRAKYDSEIASMDHALSRFTSGLAWWGEPAIALVSDHGEAFGEHGQHGHVFTLHGEVNDVAMIIHRPGNSPARVEFPVSLIDIAPTVLDMAGLDATGSLLRGVDPTRTLFAHRASPTKATTLWTVNQGPWKLLLEEGAARPPTLYDVAADPGETTDIAGDHPDRVEAFLADLTAFQARTGYRGPSVEVELDPALVEHLTLLGYVE